MNEQYQFDPNGAFRAQREVPDEVAAAEPEADVISDDAFSYDGYQVVRGEFFAHTFEPSITFNNCKVSVNSACVNKLPDVDYVQILVNPTQKKLAVRPCGEDEKDSFAWCSASLNKGRKKPKQITCRLFFAKVVELMGWNPDYRYKLLGKLIRANGEYLFVFDMNNTEIYQRILQEGKKPRNSRTPVFPAEWQNQFGLPVEEHRKSLQVNIVDGFAVFTVKNDKKAETPADEVQHSGASPTPTYGNEVKLSGF